MRHAGVSMAFASVASIWWIVTRPKRRADLRVGEAKGLFAGPKSDKECACCQRDKARSTCSGCWE